MYCEYDPHMDFKIAALYNISEWLWVIFKNATSTKDAADRFYFSHSLESSDNIILASRAASHQHNITLCIVLIRQIYIYYVIYRFNNFILGSVIIIQTQISTWFAFHVHILLSNQNHRKIIVNNCLSGTSATAGNIHNCIILIVGFVPAD